VVPRVVIFAALFVLIGLVCQQVGQTVGLPRALGKTSANQTLLTGSGQADDLLDIAANTPWQPTCPPPVINGRLGSGSPDYPSVSGVQLGRLNRNGVASACNAPKTCQLATSTGGRAYDTYTFKNNGSNQICATVTLTLPQQIGANYQANSYLGSFDPNNICANYLADPGVSSATLSQPIVYSHNVPAGASFVVVVQTTNPGEIDGSYQLKVEGLANCANVCALNCPANVSAATTVGAATVNYPLPSLAGSCQNAGAVTCAPPPGSAFAVGTTPVNCSARDGAGNTLACSFNVSVNKLSAAITQPAGCLGPGGIINASFTVTSGATSAQTLTAQANLPPELLALGGRCSYNIGGVSAGGNCSVVSPSSVVFTGMLAAGQTATVTYQAQIADSAQKGAQACINTSANFSGGPMATAQSCVPVTCDPVGEGKPLPTQFSGGDARPGSVLIFPLYTSAASNALGQNTRLSLTNLDPSRTANAHLFFVDASACEVRDAFVCLTANQTITFLASDFDPGTTGFLVVVAVDRQGCPTHFNYLIGDEYVKLGSGHTANLSAEAIPAIAGGLASCSADATTAALRFDGAAYAPLPRIVAAGGFGSRTDGNDTLLILNRIGGNLAVGGTTVSAMTSLAYDDAENPYSLSFNLTCQYRGSVWTSTRGTRFETAVPAGHSGWAKYYGNADEAFLGATLNLNRNSGAQSTSFNEGHNLHKLSYTTSAVYTIPITPPGC